MPLFRGATQLGVPTPAASGLSAWAGDPTLVGSSTIAVSGTLYLVKLANLPADTVTKLYWGVATAGATATAGQNWAGLYDSSGARLVQTGIDSDAGAGTGLKTTTLTGTALSAGSFVWGALLFNCTTPPTISRSVTGAAAVAIANAGLATSALRFAVGGTGLTTLPSSLTLGSLTAAAFAPWLAIGP